MHLSQRSPWGVYKHEPVGRGLIHCLINHERVYTLYDINPRAILQEGFIIC